MKIIKFNFVFPIVLFVLAAGSIQAQSFGFGCIGFTGAFGGYSYQKYNPTGLNKYIYFFNQNRVDSLSQKLNDFGQGNGLRFGFNFFRKKFKGFFFTTKGFYQLLVERKQAIEKLSTGEVSTKFETKLTTFGLGLDLGIPIVSFLNIKLVDAALTYTQVKLITTQNFPGAITIVNNYKSEYDLDYSVGSGIIFELFDEYVTIEGTVYYSKLNVREMKTDNDVKLTKEENSDEIMRNFITDGGLNFVLQLNIGIPL